MPRSDDSFERLRAAIDELAAGDAADLLAEARIEARARVRTTLTDALAHSMLEQLHDQLEDPEPAAPEPATPEPAAPKQAAPKRAAPTRQRRPDRRPDPVPPSPPTVDSTGEPAWYVYGVVAADAGLSDDLLGVDQGQPVTLLPEGPLAAVISLVSLDEFDETQLREHLGDMAWVETTARAHERVLDGVQDQATVVPMRMCTVYRTDGGVREMLRREANALGEALDHLRGKAEWGVKAFIELDRVEGDAPSSAEEAAGVAYMQRKRSERERRERALESAVEAAARIHERLGEITSDGLLIPLQRREVSGHGGDMIFNGVYLVAENELEPFHREVGALQAALESDGIELVPTGPWPAYNFVPGTIGAAW